jgi:hypothetical protein
MAIEAAELIESGLACAHVEETPRIFLEFVNSVYRAGVVGLALIGRTGDPANALRQWTEVSNTSPAGRFEAAAHLLGISVALVRLIEANHNNGLPANVIARSLRTGTLSLAGGLSHKTPKPKPAAVSARSSRRPLNLKGEEPPAITHPVP